jgi:hypothetical protein
MRTNELTGAALDWAVHYATHGECEGYAEHEYSTEWAQGGPIIEREEMTLNHSPYDHVFYGRSRPWCAEKKGRIEYGPTPLIAAMRCYVASKLGNDVEIPKELTGVNK